MNYVYRTLATIAFLVGAVLSGCSNPEAGEHDPGGREGRGEHDRDGREHHGGEGEESGAELALNQSYDQVRNGARLVLAYDAQSNSFSGTVKNTTDRILKRVRVEVHLSNGKELGPTTPALRPVIPFARRRWRDDGGFACSHCDDYRKDRERLSRELKTDWPSS